MGGSMGGGGSVLGVGLGAYAGYKQAKANKNALKGQKNDLLGLQGQMFSNLDPALANQENYLKKANKASEQGYSDALGDADRVETAGTKGVQDFFQQATGGVNANLASRGLLDSSVGGNMRLGAARGASRALTDVQVAASHLRTGARLGLGQARAQGLNNLGQFEAYKANARNSILSGLWDYVANQQFTSHTPQVAALAQLASGLGGGGGGGGLGFGGLGGGGSSGAVTAGAGGPGASTSGLFGFPGV